VFPVEAGGSQRIRLTYEHILDADGERFDYVLPRSESLGLRRPWTINASVVSQRPISTVYSPSHAVEAKRISAGEFHVALKGGSSNEAGAFRLSYLVGKEKGLSGTLFAYPDPSINGGYFLFMGGLPTGAGEPAAHPRREVTIVLDRSGSMAGAKIDQARDAAMQIIEGLEPGESFNIIAYSSTVMKFAPKPIAKDDDSRAEALRFIASIQPRGGTNIHDALYEALAQPASPGALPIVLFLTDGLPTIGKTSEVEIRDMVGSENPHERRVFTFGVGHDVNAPLLERLADITRAKAAFVLPGEDVELAVARVFRQLQGPVFADLAFSVLDEAGKPTTRRVDDLIPQVLPDMFDGDQLIVLGKYVGKEPIAFRLDGRFMGRKSNFRFDFDLNHATTRNAFVPRLWASRRIAFLIDEVRQAGATAGARPPMPGETILAAPEYQELIDEIVRLSREWGILTEYTSFLAREGTDLTDEAALKLGCQVQLEDNAVRTRAGASAVRQSLNSVNRKWQQTANMGNRFVDLEGRDVEFTEVQQMNDRALYKRGAQWIDSRIVADGNDSLEPDSVCAIGTDTYRALTAKLAGENRAGLLSLSGELLLLVDGQVILVTPEAPAQP
jgi:Ca-activated chloride channel family protein